MEYITRFGEPEKFTNEIKERLQYFDEDVKVKSGILLQDGAFDYEILRVRVGRNIQMDLAINGNEIIVSVPKTEWTKNPLSLKETIITVVELKNAVDNNAWLQARDVYYVYEKKVHLAKNKQMHKRQMFMDACGFLADIANNYQKAV